MSTRHFWTFEDNVVERRAAGRSIDSRHGRLFVRFRSPDAQMVFRDGLLYDNRANRDFMIRMYPPRGGGRARRAAIMFNGLDETLRQFKGDEELTFRFYDELGQRLIIRSISGGTASVTEGALSDLARGLTLARKGRYQILPGA